MATYSRRERTTTWVEYTLPNPTNWGELHKVIAVITQEIGDDRAQWDNAVEIIGGDEEIVFRWVKSDRA